MRSLKELDAELGKHNLLFGRRAEKGALCRRLMDGGGVLLRGPGGMGKTTLMLHTLRDLGGMGGPAGGAIVDSGHSFYFEDLSSFIRFLEVRKRPLTLIEGTITFRWDEAGERKESSIKVGGRGPSAEASVPISASSSMFQAERLVIRASLDAAVGPRFDIDGVVKRAEADLTRFCEDIGRAVERARRGSIAVQDEQGGAADPGGPAIPARLAAAMAGIMSGSVRPGDREHDVVLNFLEEEIAARIERCNREVYLSASSYLRPDDGPARRMSLREFEDGLQEFLENSNLDRLVPGKLTFWRWYVGIDHLERGVPGWTLDIRKEAVRMIYEKLSEKDGFHLIAAVEPNPAVIFDRVGPSSVGFEKESAVIASVPVSMPARDDFVREASSLIAENVENLNGLQRSSVQKVMADLYDHCAGRIRLYYLVRSIKSLPALQAQGVEQVEPDASFLDRQLGDALAQLGVRYEYDMSIKNLPAVQPLLELARMEERSAGTATKHTVAWLLDVYSGSALGTEKYLEAMEAYGIIRVSGQSVGLFDPYVGWELRHLSRSTGPEDLPLVSSFRSIDRLNRFLAAFEPGELLAMSDHVAAVLSGWSATSRADPGICSALLAALDGGGDFPERRRKIAILAASAAMGGALAPRDSEGREKARLAELMRSFVADSDKALTSLMSKALRKLVAGRECVFCGSTMEEGHIICTSCRADYREVCPACGERISPHFAYCAGCGAGVAKHTKVGDR